MTHRLHLVALPHTTLTDANLSCAYSQKIRKFARMMSRRGHEVLVYGPDIADGLGEAELVVTHTAEMRRRWGFGDAFNTVTGALEWDDQKPYWRVSNKRAGKAIQERAQPEDLVLLATSAQWDAAAMNPALTTVEYGVGYEGVRARFCAYESYTWQHHVYGLNANWHPDADWRAGRAYDAVIPNMFDPDEFPEGTPDFDEPYLLYIGRLIERKGPHIAALIARAAGLPLAVAGPGDPAIIDRLAPGCDYLYLGELGLEDRAAVMGGAAAVIVPTVYLEPFGGVAVEAMLTGTPVVASDWGAFTETVTPGVTGYRFRTLQEGADAVDAACRLDRRAVRDNTLMRYTLEAVAPQYEAWLDRLHGLWGDGWYSLRDTAVAAPDSPQGVARE